MRAARFLTCRMPIPLVGSNFMPELRLRIEYGILLAGGPVEPAQHKFDLDHDLTVEASTKSATLGQSAAESDIIKLKRAKWEHRAAEYAS